MRHINICIILSILITLSFVNNVSALTAAIQSAPTIYITNINIGETSKNFVKLVNKNDFPIIVNITASGDLADNVQFIENIVRLEVGEKKDVYFTIKSNKLGETNTRINLLFSTLDEKEKIGYSVNVVVTASNGNENLADDASNDNVDNDGSDDNSDNNNETNNVNVNFGGNDNSNANDNANKKLSPYIPLIITGGILLVILIILVIIGGKPKQVQEKTNEPINKNNFYNENKSAKSDKINAKKRLKEPRE